MKDFTQHQLPAAPVADAPRERLGSQGGETQNLPNDDWTLPSSAEDVKMAHYAIKYASLGWKVFPVTPDGKTPLISKAKGGNGLNDATDDPKQIEKWWAEYPDANIGLATGKASGVWVLDFDLYKAPDADTLAEFQRVYGTLPDTYVQKSARGGLHYFLRYNGSKVRTCSSKIFPHVDIRGDGGFIILSPSTFEGKPYAMERGTPKYVAPAQQKLSKAVQELSESPHLSDRQDNPKDFTGTTPYGQAALLDEIRELRAAPEGQRNETLNKCAFSLGQLIAGGELDEFETTTTLTAIAQSIGLETREIQATIRSGIEAGKKQPRSAQHEHGRGNSGGDETPCCEAQASEAKDETTSKSSYKPLAIDTFLELKLPERGHIISPVFPEQGLVMVYGPRGNGKTWFVLQMAYGIASGGDVVNHWQAPKPRRVLYIDGEMPARTMQERLASIVAGSDKEPPDPSYLSIITPDLQDMAMPNLANKEGQEALEPFIQNADVVIVDNLACLARHGKENDAESWLPVQTWLLGLRRRGKGVIVVHHAGKGGAQRGTSSREDVLDTVISLRRPQDYDPSEGARFEVHLEKARGVYGPEAAPFEAALRTGEDGKAVWTCRTLEDCERAQVLALSEEGYSVRDIATETGMSKSKVGRILKKEVKS